VVRDTSFVASTNFVGPCMLMVVFLGLIENTVFIKIDDFIYHNKKQRKYVWLAVIMIAKKLSAGWKRKTS
jgi:hypothetical protein